MQSHRVIHNFPDNGTVVKIEYGRGAKFDRSASHSTPINENESMHGQIQKDQRNMDRSRHSLVNG